MSFGAAAARRADPRAACPCGSGETYDGCCGPLLAGDDAPSPERLMRSRYTAFVLLDADHLTRTWHPRTRPAELVLDTATRWTGLEVIDAAGDGDAATVAFRAHWAREGQRGTLAERSRFARRGTRWVYVDGDVAAD